MSATIDHLSAHHRATVLKDFTDARGLAVPAGASGVIRMMDLDLKAMEFTIDWERDGRIERLTFSPIAKEAPRNAGRVESYLKLEALLVAIADLKANSQVMTDGLHALAKRVSRKDRHVVDAIRIVINELNGIDNRSPEYR
jgi:hypothetical protein